ncbi:hypothetical protein D5P88_22335, partial [Salmonella enterica subsp. enterica]|nr:hypothetical protein [Salmonella enterica subsp. enterica]
MLMGAYRWYFVFPLILFSVFSRAASPELVQSLSLPFTDADLACADKPVINDSFKGYYFKDGNYYIYYQKCIYIARGLVLHPDNQDFVTSDWHPLRALPPGIEIDEATVNHNKPSDKPDNPGDSGDTGGDTGTTDNSGGSGSTGGDVTPPARPDNPHVTPPVTPPENPFPENASLGQLRDLLTNCQRDAGRMPTADSEHYEPGPDYAYNARARQCNAIYDRLVSQLPVGAMSAPSSDKQTFMTKSGEGALYSCKPNNLSPQEWADKGLLYPGPVVGS